VRDCKAYSDILKNLNDITYRGRKMKKMSVVIGLMLVVSFFGFVTADGPRADFSWTPQEPSTADPVHFMDESTNQSDIVERIWYFGDGYGSNQKNPIHQYERPGSYIVTLIVKWNISGNVTYDEVSKQINVSNQPPVADAGPDQIVNTSTVSFDGSGSYDPDGDIVTYKWHFGDNTTGVGKKVQHRYSKDGNYTVVLNVTDDFGATDEDTCKVTVDTHAPETTVNVSGTEGENNWYKSNVTVELNAADNLAGVEKTFYRLDNGTWEEYTSPVKISEEGEHIFEYYSVDKAANKENVKNVTIKIDKTKPSLEIVSPQEKKLYIFGRAIFPTLRNTIIIGKITVEINANDSISGIEKVIIFVNGEERINFTKPPYEWRWGGEIGRRTLKIVVKDVAGWNQTKEMEVRIISLFKPQNNAMNIQATVKT